MGVLRYVREELPEADIVYVADQRHAPYGTRTLPEVSDIAVAVSSRLIDGGAATVVVACNTASAAALHTLRWRFPEVAFVGMEPAVKPAALGTRSGVIGVVATAATFQSELFESVVRRFGEGTTIKTVACPEWVELVENGVTEGPTAESSVRKHLSSILDAGADTIVLGCTHFPFLLPVIEQVSGPGVTVVDPAPAVARQVGRVHRETGTGRLEVASTGTTNQQVPLKAWLRRLDMPDAVLTFAV